MGYPVSLAASALYCERAHLFGRHGNLSGILCSPTAGHGEPGTPVLILGAGIMHRVGPSRVSVDVARALAGAGHPSLRFDLSGIGDSPRTTEGRLRDAVVADISDAITFLCDNTDCAEGGICIVGFCSGADNGFHIAGQDPRVRSIVLFDPTVHRTRGFWRRKWLRSLKSARFWSNLLTGRNLRRRLSTRESGYRPPEYYGLLVVPAEQVDAHAAALVGRGATLLYVMSGTIRHYCNAPEQIAESMPTAFSEDHFRVEWRPDFDHVLSTMEQRRAFTALVLEWMGSAGRPGVPPRT